MKDILLKLLGKYKVIGDTTYGISYQDAEELADKIIDLFANPRSRTKSQNNALWLWMTMLSKTLNEAGLDMRKVLKPSYQIDWTKDSIHDYLWIPLQKSFYGTTSTKDLKKQEQINKIHEQIMKMLGEKWEVEYIPFPVDAKKQFEKVSHGTYRE